MRNSSSLDWLRFMHTPNDYRVSRQTVFWGECLKIQKRQLTRNELVALNFIILGISQSKGGSHHESRPSYLFNNE